MKIEVISIGSELLKGTILNTNAAEISRTLFKAGFQVSRQMTITDDLVVIKQELQAAMARAEIVMTTGGLGSTFDDITRRAAAELFCSDFHYDEELAVELKKRYGESLPSLKDQATVISKAALLKNSIGTAPGYVLKSEKSTLILMPGIPEEMKVMLEEQVLPYLEKQSHKMLRHYQRSFHFFGLAESIVDPFLRKIIEKYPTLEYGIYPGAGVLTISLKVIAKNAKEANEKLDDPCKEVALKYSPQIFETPNGKIEEAIHQRFIDNGWTLSLAESCTGGSFAARLTLLPGASRYFLGSVVAYSNELKKKILGVSDESLRNRGAVSEEVVIEMAEGLLRLTKSDFGIAVSGIAGPNGGTEEKPVGTIYGAISRVDHPTKAFKFHLRGNRRMIIQKSINLLLGELLNSTSSVTSFS